MSLDQIVDIIRQTFLVTLELAAPFLILSMLVGLLFSLLQSVAKVQDMTLTFVPKMLIVGVAIAICLPWIIKILTKFTHTLFVEQWARVVHDNIYVLPSSL